VLLNLVMNGTDAMADVSAGREITLHTHATDTGGVQVSVTDAGRGIPEEDIERIFPRSSRQNQRHRTRFGGLRVDHPDAARHDLGDEQ
jgi:signal transduction histidine kinase